MQDLKPRLHALDVLADNLDGVAIFNLGRETIDSSDYDPSFFYFTNSDVGGVFYYDFSKSTLFTNIMDYGAAKKSWIKNVVVMKGLGEFLSHIKGKRIGIDKKNMSVGLFQRLGKTALFQDISPFLETLRAVKTPFEQRMIRQACVISKHVFKRAEKEISPSLTEYDLKGLIEFFMSKYRVSRAFPTIVATGNNVRFPHHKAGSRKLSSPLLIDFGVRYDGYVSDISRTFDSPYQELLERSIQEVFALVKPGVTGSQLHAKACEALGSHKKYFITALGHGIGIQVHEAPYIAPSGKTPLQPGMVFTIEPGIYRNGGIRIEHDILLTKDGFVNLSAF